MGGGGERGRGGGGMGGLRIGFSLYLRRRILAIGPDVIPCG